MIPEIIWMSMGSNKMAVMFKCLIDLHMSVSPNERDNGFQWETSALHTQNLNTVPTYIEMTTSTLTRNTHTHTHTYPDYGCSKYSKSEMQSSDVKMGLGWMEVAPHVTLPGSILRFSLISVYLIRYACITIEIYTRYVRASVCR